MKTQEAIMVKKATTKELETCLAIRRKVFIEGQKIPVNEEVDGLDSESDHYLISYNQLAVGTARVRYIENFAKLERVAILDAYQNQGLGQILMQYIINELKQNPQLKKLKLGAQVYALGFYEKLGFAVCSEEYLDAGIPHKTMQFIF